MREVPCTRRYDGRSVCRGKVPIGVAELVNDFVDELLW
jgi:hypothetical protein